MKLHKAIVLSAWWVALIWWVLFAAKNLQTDLDNAVQTIWSVTISTWWNSATLSWDSAWNLNIRTNNFIIKNGSISNSSWSSIFWWTGNQISNSKNSTIVAWENNQISSTTNSFIWGGSGNKITAWENNAIPWWNSNTINGSHSVIVWNSNSLSWAHNAIVWQNNEIQWWAYSVVMWSGGTLSTSNSFLWSSGNKAVNLNQNDVFAVMWKMAVNTWNLKWNAWLHIWAPLIVSTWENTNIACNSNLKWSLKLVKKYDSNDNSSFKNQMCLCSCNGSGWTSVENSKFCEKPCTAETHYVEEPDNGWCGDVDKVSFSITGWVTNKDNACSENYKLIEDSFLLSGQREDNMAKLWWACQNEYGKTVSCSKTFEYKCVKNSSYTKFTSIIPANAQWNNNVLPNSQKPVEHSSTKSDICSFSCDKWYSWVDDGWYDCFKQCDWHNNTKKNHNEEVNVYNTAEPICYNDCNKAKVTLICKNGQWKDKGNNNDVDYKSYSQTCKTQKWYEVYTYSYPRSDYISQGLTKWACNLTKYTTIAEWKRWIVWYQPSIVNGSLEAYCYQYYKNYQNDMECDSNRGEEYLYVCNNSYHWDTEEENCVKNQCDPLNRHSSTSNITYSTGSINVGSSVPLEKQWNEITCHANFHCNDNPKSMTWNWSLGQETCFCNATTDLPSGVKVDENTVVNYTKDGRECTQKYKCTTNWWEKDGDENCPPIPPVKLCQWTESSPWTWNSDESWACTWGAEAELLNSNPIWKRNFQYPCTKSNGGFEICYWECPNTDQIWNGSECVDTGWKCTNIPSNATLITGSNTGLTWDTPSTLFNSVQDARNIKCAYVCNSCYKRSGNQCEPDTSNQCNPKCGTGNSVNDYNSTKYGNLCVGTDLTTPSAAWWWPTAVDDDEAKYTWACSGVGQCTGTCLGGEVWDNNLKICHNPIPDTKKCSINIWECINEKRETTNVDSIDKNSYTTWTCWLQTCAKCKNGYEYQTWGNILKAYWMDNTEPEEEWGYCTTGSITCQSGPITHNGRTYILPKGEEWSTTWGIAWTWNKSNIKECYANFKCESWIWKPTAESCVSCPTNSVTWWASLPTFCGSDSELVGRSFWGTAWEIDFNYKCKSKNNYDLQMTCKWKCDATNNYHLINNNPIVNGTNSTLHNMACAKWPWQDPENYECHYCATRWFPYCFPIDFSSSCNEASYH